MSNNNRATGWGARLLLAAVIVGAMLVVAPAHVRALAAGSDTITLSITNGTSFIYGIDTPRFTVTIVLATADRRASFDPIITIDSGETLYPASSNESLDATTFNYYYLANNGPITSGARTASTNFTDPLTGVTLQSNSVNFTITPANPQMNCSTVNAPNLASPSQALTVAFTYNNPPAPVDWQDGTYTVSFSGPQDTTFPNMKGDSNDDVMVTAPSQVGIYKITCAFSGTNNFQASSGTLGYITVSEKHALGAVQFYTNPTTPATGKPISVYVVFHPAPGLPTPTGYVSFTLTGVVGDSTNIIQLNSDETLLVNLGAIPVELTSGSTWYVNYDGDPYYDTARVSFPLTNQPIPGNSGGGGSGSGGSFGAPQATPSGTPRATTTATATREATPAATLVPVSSHAVIGSSGGATPVMLASGGLGALVALGGAGAFLVWSRRRRLALGASANTPNAADTGADGYTGHSFMSAPPTGTEPSYDDRTIADDGAFPYRQE